MILGPATGSGYTWYKINFDSGADGWVAQDYLAKVVFANVPQSQTALAGQAAVAQALDTLPQIKQQLQDLLLRVESLIGQMSQNATPPTLH